MVSAYPGPVAEWNPSANARPSEWLLRMNEHENPYAVVRRFLYGDRNHPEEWFRVVTWSPTSETRELIGWVRTFDAACKLGWDYHLAYESWRHHLAARRADPAQMEAARRPAAELVRFYREHQAETTKDPRPTRRGMDRGS